MWRSVVAARASLCSRTVRNLSRNQNPTFPSIKRVSPASPLIFPKRSSLQYQDSRFFSQISENPSDSEIHLSESTGSGLEAEHASVDFGENGCAEVNNFASGEEIYEPLNENIEENGDTHTEQFVQDNAEEGIYEIDLEKLESVLSLLQSSPDGSLESTLENIGLALHEEFVVRVLETPHVLGENLIRFFKWAMQEKAPDFKVTARVVDALTRAVRCGGMRKKKDAYALWDLIKEIGENENGVLNTETLNVLIAHFSELGKGKAAVEVLDKFSDFGCVPNADTYYFTIEALCRRCMFEFAWSVSQRMIDAETLPDGLKIGKLISWFCKGRKAKDAHLLYTLAKDRKQYPPRSSFNFLISSLSKEDQTVKLALEMLDDVEGEARKFAIKPFSSVIRGLCRMKDVEEAKILLLKMINDGPPPGNAVFNSVINGYAKAGDLEKAMEIVESMESRGLKPDVYTYTVIMSGYCSGGQIEEACKILSDAKEKHSKLSPATYHTLIRGFCKLEEFDKALKLMNEMKDFGVEANVDEYQKLIQSLCLRALDWETAEKLLEEMKEKGLHLNGIIRGLIKAVKELHLEEAETVQMISD
ncbi:hypothetical protein FNV43_RR09625 [Rhamnella rubrinervis]|uniref:Pentatricopeptide repeat-containing protein n=1 Tax=Rhamnella rubrinervis TaxID=2594499 RepID=A0A8K0HB52_9ROSA|nr:hypothetical protein FNV43_RR09625 [Rhamnella rubrinervis]